VLLSVVALSGDPGLAEPTKPADSAIKEQVEVTLVEVLIHVTDRKGKPITDLKQEEIKVFEGDVEQSVAFLESVSKRGADRSHSGTFVPATTYDASGKATPQAQDVIVLSPLPKRRVVIVFDPANSRQRARKDWKNSAIDWVRSAMLPSDLAGIVVFHATPEWIQQPTADKQVLLAALEGLDLESRGANRDRRQEMSKFVSEIQACVDVSTKGGAAPPSAGAVGNPYGAPDDVECAMRIAEPYVHDWGVQASESVNNLRTLTGQLAAVEGRKEVLLFSEGIVPDSAGLAVAAFTSLFPADRLPQQSLLSRLRSDVARELTELQDAARGAGVVFFTFDTRNAADRGYFETSEYARPITATTLGVNPYAEVYEATASTLEILAAESGGRSFHGTNELTEDVFDAADSYYGIYNLGYYRAEGKGRPGKLKLKLSRKGLRVNHPSTSARRIVPRPAKLEIAVGRPELTAHESNQLLPVLLQLPFSELPLRKEGGVLGCQLGYFVQAARADGTVVDERFLDSTVAIEANADRSTQKDVRQMLKLELPPGSYRLRARVSDDRQSIVAERAIDLTLAIGEIRSGFAPEPSDPAVDSKVP
jgi:VWFA-related protein